MRLREQYEDYLREKLEIDIMTQRNPYEVRRINEILEIMVDVLNSKAKTIRISGEDKPAEVVKAQFMKLDSSHMEYILDCFKNQTSDIHNIKQYLLTTIYNAPLTIDHYYTAKVLWSSIMPRIVKRPNMVNISVPTLARLKQLMKNSCSQKENMSV